jgi:hypothetical protein
MKVFIGVSRIAADYIRSVTMVNERWKLGLVLALTASILWGVLPIAVRPGQKLT